MKNLLTISFLFFCAVSFSQTTPIVVSRIGTGSADLNRPGGGAEQWQDQNVSNIPVAGTNTRRLDVYWRFRWSNFQPLTTTAPYTFDFTKFDQVVQGCINNGQKLSVSIMQICSNCNDFGETVSILGSPSSFPKYAYDSMQAEAGTAKPFTFNGRWQPNMNSPSWLRIWTRLQAAVHSYAMGKTYNGVRYQDIINFIDINGYGDYGEWTNNPYSGGVWAGPSGTLPTTASLNAIIDATALTWHEFQCQAINATFDAMQLNNTNIPAAVGLHALQLTNDRGPMGYRRESWGATNSFYYNWTDGNPTVVSGYHFDTAISNRYKYAPVSGEPCCPPGDGFAAMVGQMQTYHVGSFGNGNVYPPGDGDATTINNNLRAASKNAGYRLTIDTGFRTTTPPSGGQFIVKLDWRNANGIPAYDDWNVVFRIKSGATTLQQWTSKFKPRLFYSTTAVTYIDTVNLTSVPSGSGYTLNMSVEDPKGYRFPMPIFITGVKSDGSYDLATGITVSGSGAPVASAGTNQTINSPASSVTLDGTGSSGTISSRLWTRITGPNTPTIVSPTSATTSVTGLITGTYVFQLSLNSGASTSQVTVTVNPPIPPADNIFTAQVPVATTDNDNTVQVGMEYGVRFKSSITGYILGVRFYKTAGNNGTHTGQLYSTSGTLLASAVITSETPTGWQVARFTTPIPIAANTNYVAAIHSSLGFYVEDNDFFLNNATVNRTLTAIQDGTAGASGTDPGTGQGLFLYTTSPAFPTQLYRSANYYADVIFSQDIPGTIIHKKAHIIYFK